MAKSPRKSGSGGRSKSGGLPRINPKSGKPYSAAYRQRIERGLAKGKSRQEARGKKAGEYKERAKRETAKYGRTPSERRRLFTPPQRKAIKEFAKSRAQARGRGTTYGDFLPAMEDWAEDHGFDDFEDMAGEVEALGHKGGGSAAYMWDIIDNYDIDPAWIFYEEDA